MTSLRMCACCGQPVRVSFDRTGTPPTSVPGDPPDVLCRCCVQRWGQNPDAPYIVAWGAYYRKAGEAFVKIGPVGAFHG
jgi:hypothetical protein